MARTSSHVARASCHVARASCHMADASRDPKNNRRRRYHGHRQTFIQLFHCFYWCRVCFLYEGTSLENGVRLWRDRKVAEMNVTNDEAPSSSSCGRIQLTGSNWRPPIGRYRNIPQWENRARLYTCTTIISCLVALTYYALYWITSVSFISRILFCGAKLKRSNFSPQHYRFFSTVKDFNVIM